MSLRRIIRRITGFSTPVFGISWSVESDDREAVRRLLAFLEDRRVLYNRYDNEVANSVVSSIQELRGELVETLQTLKESSRAVTDIRGMLAECRRFLDDASSSAKSVRRISELEGTFGGLGGDVKTRSWEHYKATINFYTTLGILRRGFGGHIVSLCELYKMESPLLEHFGLRNKEDSKTTTL